MAAALILGLIPIGLWMRASIAAPAGPEFSAVVDVDVSDAAGPSAEQQAAESAVAPVRDLAPPWEVIAGTWTQQGERIAQQPGDAPLLEPSAIAVVFLGADPAVGVTFVEPRRGDGVLVRYADPENHWMIFADPPAGLWRVVKVIDGLAIAVTELGPLGAQQRIAVASSEAAVTITLDERDPVEISDPELAGAASVGLIALDPDSRSEWTHFRAGAGVGLPGVEVTVG